MDKCEHKEDKTYATITSNFPINLEANESHLSFVFTHTKRGSVVKYISLSCLALFLLELVLQASVFWLKLFSQ